MNRKSINIVLLLSCFTYLSCSSSLIFFPVKNITTTPDKRGLQYESVFFKASDGIKINAWWVPKNNARGTVLFSHGNADNISQNIESIKIFNSLGLNVFIYDYRGYGKSQGEPSEKGTEKDAEAAWDYLTKIKKISGDDIIIFGRSLGGAVSAKLAEKHTPELLILESTFTSAKEVAEFHLSCMPAGIVFGDTFNTLARIKKIRCPVLIIHSRDDRVIPFEHGRLLYESANSPKFFLEIQGGHNSGFKESITIYKNGLNKFISKYINKIVGQD